MSRASVAIVAALIRDAEGRVLLVRKAGTRVFMQPGGKREVGEDDLAALDRELAEEIGCNMIAGSAVAMGDFVAPAANKADRDLPRPYMRWPLPGPRNRTPRERKYFGSIPAICQTSTSRRSAATMSCRWPA